MQLEVFGKIGEGGFGTVYQVLLVMLAACIVPENACIVLFLTYEGRLACSDGRRHHEYGVSVLHLKNCTKSMVSFPQVHSEIHHFNGVAA